MQVTTLIAESDAFKSKSRESGASGNNYAADLSYYLHSQNQKIERVQRADLSFVFAQLEALMPHEYFEVLEYAEQVFGDKSKAQRWLTKPRHQFGGELPLSLLDTVEGRKSVTELLGQIDHGMVG